MLDASEEPTLPPARWDGDADARGAAGDPGAGLCRRALDCVTRLWRSNPPLSALLVYSFSYFTGLGMLAIPIPMLFNVLTSGDPGVVTSAGQFALGAFGVVNQCCQFLMARFWGEFSDAYGRRVCLLISAVGTTVLHTVCSFSPVLWPLFVGIAAEGLTSTAYSASQGYISDVSTSETLGANFGLFFGLAVGGGMAVGVPLSAGIITYAEGDPRWSLRSSAAILALGIMGVWLWVPESLKPARRRPIKWANANPIGAFRLGGRNGFIGGTCLTYFFLTMAQGGVYGIFMNYVTMQFNWSLFTDSVYFVIMGFGMTVYPRILIPRFGERKCILGGCVLQLFSLAVMSLDPVGWFLLFSSIFLEASDVVYPATLSLLAKQVPRAEQGAIQGTADSIRTVGFGVGGALTSAIFGYFISSQDPDPPANPPPFIPAAGFMFCGILYLFALATFGVTTCCWGSQYVDTSVHGKAEPEADAAADARADSGEAAAPRAVARLRTPQLSSGSSERTPLTGSPTTPLMSTPPLSTDPDGGRDHHDASRGDGSPGVAAGAVIV